MGGWWGVVITVVLLYIGEERFCRAEAQEEVEAHRDMSLVVGDEEAHYLLVLAVFFLHV